MSDETSQHEAPDDLAPGDPFTVRDAGEIAADLGVHIIRPGVRCETEGRGHATPRGTSRLEIVVDATEGFVPLWAKGATLRWRFRESSLQHFTNREAAKKAIQTLLGEAILAWGDAAPVRFSKSSGAWDFEVVVLRNDDCDANGCVLASAFFPDGGRHRLNIYPFLFRQTREEQIETLAHEIGHIFGLRHFFALVSERAWPARVFGEHSKFSIMNYGGDSKLTAFDKADLKTLYEQAWAGKLTAINGTPIKFVRPHHDSGVAADRLPIAAGLG